jgi:hypothetical protein
VNSWAFMAGAPSTNAKEQGRSLSSSTTTQPLGLIPTPKSWKLLAPNASSTTTSSPRASSWTGRSLARAHAADPVHMHTT